MFTSLPEIATVTAAIAFATAAGIGFAVGRLAACPIIQRLRTELADAAWRLTRDPLTGLYNRLGLRTVHTGLAEAESQPIIVMLLDLDRFKTINDTYGHDAGDEILTEIAGRIGTLAAVHDGCAARLSGDEYAILLPVRDDAITDIGDRFTTIIAAPIEIYADDSPVSLTVTASIGIALVSSTDPLEDIALHRADTAMFHAKIHGGNRHTLYAPGMTMPTRQPRRGPRQRDRRHRRGVTA